MEALIDEEFNPNQEGEEHDSDEWEDALDPDESASQVSHTTYTGSEASSLDITTSGSAVWLHFDREPSYAPGYNVCKICSNRYKVTTGVSSLRKHLKKHELKAPAKKYNNSNKKSEPFDEQQEIHNKYLIDWLICNLHPFNVVEDDHFRAFINFFCPCYTIPDRHKIKGKLS